MKGLLLTILLFCAPLVSAQTIIEFQKQIKNLEQDILILNQKNSVLQQKVDFCDLYTSTSTEVRTFNQNFEFKVIECVGNSIDQTVEVMVTIKHSLPHQELSLYIGSEKPIAYSEIGTSYEFKESTFPNSSFGLGTVNFNCPTNLLIQGKLTFRNILPQTKKLSLINGIFEFKNKDGGGNKNKGEFEIRNLTINWI